MWRQITKAAFRRSKRPNGKRPSFFEQALIAMLSDRQIPHAIEELHTVVTSALSQHAAEVSATNAAQWEAIEQLILALLGDSERCRLARNNDQASNLGSTPSVNKVA